MVKRDVCNSVSKEYSARMTGNQFLYPEFKVAVKLLQEGLNKKEATDKIINENLFEYRSFKAINKHIGAVWERANYLDDYLIEVLLTEPNEIGRLINFYAILKYDRLFLEFMEEVLIDKMFSRQMEVSKSDISNYFSIKAEQSETVANFKETTLKRLRLAYFEILSGAGYIGTNRDNAELTIPLGIYQITNHLEEIGDKRYAKAMLG